MKILVTGAREWTNRDSIRAALERCLDGSHVLIHGDCRGADRIAASIAKSMGWEIEAYPADWERYKPPAGSKRKNPAGAIRNRRMLTEGEPELVIAFHHDLTKSKGTADMVRVARSAGVPVVVVPL